MIEQLILVDEKDKEVGSCEKMEAHKKGLLHRAFSILLLNKKGEMLLQKRFSGKYHSGGLWTNACCGHPRPEEDTKVAAIRRMMEELGMTCPLDKSFTFCYKAPFDNGLIEHEFVHVYRGVYEGDFDPNPQEVEDLKWISLNDLKEDIFLNPRNYTAWFLLYCQEKWEEIKDNNAMEKKTYDSLNFNMRPLDVGPPDMIILHHTNMKPVDAALERLSDPNSKVSCHYLIAADGAVYEMVHETMRAWHAGVSFWKDRTNINDHSIGIELDSLGDIFTAPLMKSLVWLIQDIRTRYIIPDLNILGHSDIAPNRKDDPSEHFDWEFLAVHGIGWMPKGTEILREIPPTVAIQSWLRHIGYSIDLTGIVDSQTQWVVKAFQRHFRREKVDGILDLETITRILERKEASV